MCGKNCGKLQEKPNKLQNKHLEISSSISIHLLSFSFQFLLWLSRPRKTFSFMRTIRASFVRLASVIKQSGWTGWFFLLARGRALLPTAQKQMLQNVKKENDYLKLQTSLSLSSRAGNIRIALLSLATSVSLFFPLSLSLSQLRLSSLAVPLGQTLNLAESHSGEGTSSPHRWVAQVTKAQCEWLQPSSQHSSKPTS